MQRKWKNTNNLEGGKKDLQKTKEHIDSEPREGLKNPVDIVQGEIMGFQRIQYYDLM